MQKVQCNLCGVVPDRLKGYRPVLVIYGRELCTTLCTICLVKIASAENTVGWWQDKSVFDVINPRNSVRYYISPGTFIEVT